ncbi:FAD-binding dehydrogenase [Gordonibacter sp. An230]|uniref:FAD-dependent oxidoreductase n=1 Tax=Gordonibacter sp. An230 TaxID=1965592 RepID=UPI000B39E8ED|nr:FAD-dependent oxidoreductase [Gordonibacter sp. An230]OUO90205.1 FAD-binding dehydrogenase [Gordonibacter sp. An230]
MKRRGFFKLAGMSAAAFAASGVLAACGAGQLPADPLRSGSDEGGGNPSVAGDSGVSFSSEVDVLVVGSGIAGLSAAMAPAEAKRSVLVVDKLDLLGGESYEANGVMRVAGSAVQQRAGLHATVASEWRARKKELEAAGTTDFEFARTLFEAATSWADHLADEYGAQFADPAEYAQDDCNTSVLLPKGGLGDMESVMVPLRDGLASKGVSFLTGLRAKAFILDEESEVCGMRFVANEGGSMTDVRARCIVMATGGFVSNQALVHAYTPDRERAGCYTVASMGEGQLLCASIGGQLTGMDKAAPLTGDLPQVSAWSLFGPVAAVDTQGVRFAREDGSGATADACFEDERGLWWTVFDGQLSESSQSRSIAELTSKNAKRIAGPCDDEDALAGQMGVPADKLKATLERYNEQARAGKDDDFGRTLFLKPLEAPFYAVKQQPMRYRSRGGAATDGMGRLLNATGAPISRVYCCGAVANGGSDGLASNGAFGMLAGQAVASFLAEEDGRENA